MRVQYDRVGLTRFSPVTKKARRNLPSRRAFDQLGNYDLKVVPAHFACVGVAWMLHCNTFPDHHFCYPSMAPAWHQCWLCVAHVTADSRQVFESAGWGGLSIEPLFVKRVLHQACLKQLR